MMRRGFCLALMLVVPACNQRFDFDTTASSGGAGGVNGAGVAGGGGTDAGSSQGGTGGITAADIELCQLRCAVYGLMCHPPNLSCVECLDDDDCQRVDRNYPVCSGGSKLPHRCVKCTANSQCRVAEACVPDAHVCVPACGEDEDPICSAQGPKPECAVGHGYCEGCFDDDDCAALTGTPHCSDSRVGCVQCRSDADCADRTDAQHCDPVLTRCVDCRDSRDCSSSQICDRWEHICR
jgi:hypothetical protein